MCSFLTRSLALQGGTLLLAVFLCTFPFISPASGLHHHGQEHLLERGDQRGAQDGSQKAAIHLELISYHLNTSTSDLSSALLKRVDALDFPNLVCKGDEVIRTVIGRTAPPERVWRHSDLDNGWGSTDLDFLPGVRGIEPALQEFEIPYDTRHGRYQWWEQWKRFTIGSDPRQYEPTGGRYRNSYIVAGEKSMIICHSSFSPRQQARPGQPFPELYRWSDVVWLAWAQIAGNQKSQLRYIVHDDIVTPATRKWMEYIEVASPDTNFLPWPGQLYDLQSDEGKALLATPHGVGLAYMLADHRYELDGKIYPVVCMWTAPSVATYSHSRNNYFMMWQLRDAAEGGIEIDRPRTCRDMV
ncbi:MAG: hypothetical protein LQ346_004904 [Caloplaca aetnensis]|nr:MAG: hypothetical protein LQ346_004904 [Caloplaca aetnensis]